MFSKLIEIFKNHTLLCLYVIIFFLLLHGVYVISGTQYFGYMFLFFGSLIATYFLFNWIGIRNWFKKFLENKKFKINSEWVRYGYYFLVVYTLSVVIYHFWLMGGSPPLMAINAESADEVAKVRANITAEASTILKYLSSFTIKGVLPFLILYTLMKKRYVVYYILLIVGSFYAYSLMQKSFIITILVPVFIYSMLQKKFWYTIKYAVLIIGVILSLAFTANPEIRPTMGGDDFNDTFSAEQLEQLDSMAVNKGDEKNVSSATMRIVKGLWRRITVVPGEMVAEWFRVVPEHKPYLYGDGYRVVAKLKGDEHRNYSKELFPYIRPTYVKRGLHGSVNAASFMYDYSNFGTWGLLLSGFILGILFLFIEGIFSQDFKMKFSLNLFPILGISSAALTTTLYSGGWGLLLLLYLLLIKGEEDKNQSELKD